jgi:hypothetical protein
MANAIANYLQKKLLMVNFPSLREKSMSELMRLIFREAKLYDAIIFFGTLARLLIVFAWFGLPDSCQASTFPDECESLFESRNQSKSNDLTSLLTEIEHYDGLVVMVRQPSATNANMSMLTSSSLAHNHTVSGHEPALRPRRGHVQVRTANSHCQRHGRTLGLAH